MSSTDRDHRTRRDQRLRGDPVGGRAPRRPTGATWCTTTATPSFTWDYEKGARPKLDKLYEKAKSAQWNGADRPAVGHRGGPGAAGHRQRRGQRRRHAVGQDRPHRHRAREVVREGVGPVRRREPELDALPVHARRAGGAAVHGQDRRDGAVDRRQVLRRHPGDGRGPPRRGVLASTSTRSCRATTRSTATCGCCSTTSSPTRAGT